MNIPVNLAHFTWAGAKKAHRKKISTKALGARPTHGPSLT